MRREFTYLGRLIVIEEPDEQSRPDEGVSGESASHGHAGHGGDEPGRGDHHDHDGDHEIVIVIDGREVMVHHLASGYYHSHEFPFMRFSTIEDLAKAFTNYLEFGVHRGHSEEPE